MKDAGQACILSHMNLPNLISLARLITVPLIIWMVLKELYLLAFVSFLVAGLSDALDGILARLLKAHTTLGAYLDPLADKALLVSMFATLGYKSLIPMWVVIAVIFRDILIIGGAFLLFMIGRTFIIKPIVVSKINTFIQVVTVIYVLAQQGFELKLPFVSDIIFYVVGASTIISGAAYIIIWLKHINGEKN